MFTNYQGSKNSWRQYVISLGNLKKIHFHLNMFTVHFGSFWQMNYILNACSKRTIKKASRWTDWNKSMCINNTISKMYCNCFFKYQDYYLKYNYIKTPLNSMYFQSLNTKRSLMKFTNFLPSWFIYLHIHILPLFLLSNLG